jgi:hypothetical protein
MEITQVLPSMCQASKRGRRAERAPEETPRKRVDEAVRAHFERLCSQVVVTEAELDLIRNYDFGA